MKAKPGYIVRKIADMNILVPEADEMDFSNVVTVNGTGLFIWECLQTDCTADEILKKMCEKFDAPQDVLRADLAEYLDALEKEGLIVG